MAIGQQSYQQSIHQMLLPDDNLPYGFPQQEAPSNRKIFEHYAANPDHFVRNENTSYRALATNSKYSKELISAVYLRGDLSLIDQRLRLVGGVRAEQTNVKAFGPLTDPTRNYQRDARGEVVLGPNGAPLLIEPATNTRRRPWAIARTSSMSA